MLKLRQVFIFSFNHNMVFFSPLTFSTGKYVKLADGAILVQVGTMWH